MVSWNVTRNCDIILAVVIVSGDALPLCYVTSIMEDMHDFVNNCTSLLAQHYGDLYVITTKGNLIVHKKGNSGVD